MSGNKSMICLASSRKPDGRCIAGKELIEGRFGPWVRPVSSRTTHEISDLDRRFENGDFPKLLDVINVPILSASPLGHQHENVVIDDKYYWEKLGDLKWENLRSALDHPESLWANNDSTWHGINDRVHRDLAAKFTSSLYLIEPERLHICVKVETSMFKPPSRKIRARFTYRSIEYDFYMTDPEIEELFRAKPNGVYPLTETYLSISLSEPHSRGDGNCYKLVAAIISSNPL